MTYIGLLTGIHIIRHFIESRTMQIRMIYQDRDDQPQLLIRAAEYVYESWIILGMGSANERRRYVRRLSLSEPIRRRPLWVH